MTSRQSVLEAERKLRAILDGTMDGTMCPFCRKWFQIGDGQMCCLELAGMVDAIVNHREFLALQEVAEELGSRN
jgi:hypothetical protein